MAAKTPGQVIEEFVRLFASGDVEALVEECYEDDAVFIPEASTGTASGKAAVRDGLKGFVETQGTLSVLASTVFENGDIALTHTHWRLDIAGADSLEGRTAEIVRKQPDGTWKYAIDNPWGADVLGG